MIRFITDRWNENEPDILADKPTENLMIVSLDHQCLAVYKAPSGGWTHDVLVRLSRYFPPQWDFCGADALIGERFVGSTEI